MSTSDINIEAQASKQPKPLFQITLGPHHITQMVPLGESTFFLGLKKDDIDLSSSKYVLVDTEKGNIMWEYTCGRGAYHLLLTTENRIVLQVESQKEIRVIALDTNSGDEVWSMRHKGAGVSIVPNDEYGGILVSYPTKRNRNLYFYDVITGKQKWSLENLPLETSKAFVQIDKDKVFLFSEDVKVFSIIDGAKLYTVENIAIQKLDPLIPTFDDHRFYLLDDANKLRSFALSDGHEQWSFTLKIKLSVTNITSTTSNIYIRGQADEDDFRIHALTKESGKELWAFESEHPMTSNFISEDEVLFLGNASSLNAIDVETGSIIYSKKVAQSGRTFPIALRRIGEHIVHIGELVVAAFHAKTGTLVYKRGFSPISVNMHFNGLDAAIPALKNRLAIQEGYTGSGAPSMASRESAHYQKMANESYADYLRLRQSNQSGTTLRANMERNKARMNSSMSRAFSSIAMGLSIIELGNALTNYLEQRATQAEIKRQQYYRNSILKVYNSALSESYVYRPHLQFLSSDNQFIVLDIVTLTDGSVERYYLSPQYLDFGLWNFVDFDSGIIYHHGVGMNPSEYTLYHTKRTPMVSSKTVGTFLIAYRLNR